MGQFRKTVYGAGHANLDRDHFLLLDLVEKLKNGNKSETALTEFLAYLDAHTEHEEELMELYRYPEKEAHKAAHDELKSEAARLLPGWQTTPVAEIAATIEGWIKVHMLDADVRFAAFLNSLAVPPCGSEVGYFSETGPVSEVR